MREVKILGKDFWIVNTISLLFSFKIALELGWYS